MKTSIFTPARLLAAALPLLFFASCKPGTSDTTRGPAVNPPLMTAVPFQDFDIDAQAGDTISLTDGTSIYVPQSIFVDESGKPVTGKVQLHYRAFYTPGEIVASGISMLYDTAGTDHTFSSAGMFELTGTQNGKPVSIAPGKSISMDFASSRNDMSFSFYNLDTTARNWKFLSTTKADSNQVKKQLLSAITAAPRRPVQPRQYDPKQPVINIDVDPSDHPELSGYSNIMWQYAGTGSNPEENRWIYDNDWSTVKLQMIDTNTCTYKMDMWGSDKTFSTNVYPSLKGDNYQKAMNDYKQQLLAFEAGERDRQEKRKDAAGMKDYQRRLNVGRFGIFNCDFFARIGKQPDYASLQFVFDDPEFEKNRDSVIVYFSTIDNQYINEYTGDFSPNVVYDKERKTSAIAIIRHTDKACVVTSGEFKNTVLPDNTITTLRFHVVPDKIGDSKAFDALLNSL